MIGMAKARRASSKGSFTTLDTFFKAEEKKEEEKKEVEEKTKIPSKVEISIKLFDEKRKRLLKLAKKNREIENAKNLFLFSVEYNPTENKALMKFYDEKTGKVFLLHDRTGHKPYMLTDLPEEVIRRAAKKMRGKLEGIVEIERYDLIEDTLRKLKKVIVSDPLAVGGPRGLRNILGEEHSWEAWIQYHLNYIYDAKLWPSTYYDVEDGKPILKKVTSADYKEIYKVLSEDLHELADEYLPVLMSPIPNIDFVALDIEVAGGGKMPSMKQPVDPIVAISLVKYQFREQREVVTGEIWLLRTFRGVEKKLGDIKIKESREYYLLGELDVNGHITTVKIYFDERLMLMDLFEELWDVPILVTFNGDNFDLRYLYKRAEYLGIPDEIIPFKIVSKGEIKEGHMKVGIHIDLYKFYGNPAIKAYAFSNKYDQVSLDELSRTLLGMEKRYHELEVIEELELDELARYNWWDAYLTALLFAYNNMLPLKLLITLSRITKYPIRELSRRGVSAWIENWFYYEHRKRNYLIPNRKQLDEKEERISKFGPRPPPVIIGKKYRGAIVFEPKPGIWFNVWVLDFASIYPTIIKVHNISYETVDCPHPECRDNMVPETPHWICKKRKGLASQLVGFVRDVRVKYFKKLAKTEKNPLLREHYNIIQGALKVLMNASYGVFGASHFPLYSLSTAETITAFGRQKILKVAEKAKELGLEVIYGDTDSIFVYNPDEKQIKELIEWCEKELKVDLEVDKIYVYVAFSARKKNYFGVFPDGNVDIKGLLAKKRNTPEFLKKEFRHVIDVLRQVKNMEEMEKAKEKIEDIILTIIRKLRKGEYDVKDLAIKVQITKPLSEYTKITPPHVRAARKLKREVRPGEIIAYVKTKDDVLPVELNPRKSEIDWDKYLEYTRSVFEQLLDALQMSYSEIEAKAKGVVDLSSLLKS